MENFRQFPKEKEIWISEDGAVLKNRTQAIKIQNMTHNPDYKIFFHKGKGYTLHRAVAETFPEICGEWFEECEVHHINQDPSDNRAINLVVLTKEEHSKRHRGSIKNKRVEHQILQMDKNFHPVKVFENKEQLIDEGLIYEEIVNSIIYSEQVDGYYYAFM